MAFFFQQLVSAFLVLLNYSFCQMLKGIINFKGTQDELVQTAPNVYFAGIVSKCIFTVFFLLFVQLLDIWHLISKNHAAKYCKLLFKMSPFVNLLRWFKVWKAAGKDKLWIYVFLHRGSWAGRKCFEGFEGEKDHSKTSSACYQVHLPWFATIWELVYV